MLVDTSIWIDHLRRPQPGLVALLESDLVVTHPFIIGELACGTLRDRETFLGFLRRLPSAPTISDDEALQAVEASSLWGRGLGWVDVHLLASARVGAIGLWTRDRVLAEAASDLGIPGGG